MKRGVTIERLSTLKMNTMSLERTIDRHRESSPPFGFVIALNAFIAELRAALADPGYKITSPHIYPKRKTKVKSLQAGAENICRPISLFELKDKIILSLTNQYLTKLLDPQFSSCSFAFRAASKPSQPPPSHHDAIRKLVQYRQRFEGESLWVSERDMEKFYDSVNHRVIMERFEVIKQVLEAKDPTLDFTIPTRIFEKYLKCYSFNRNVLPLNEDTKWWQEHRIEGGRFEWIAAQLKDSGYYEDLDNEDIGVPQGGTLSGLIANIVLDSVDKTIPADDRLLYLRFCDDMLIIHPDRDRCESITNTYEDALKGSLLVPHKVAPSESLVRERKVSRKYFPRMSTGPFWRRKSKGPYLWGPFNENSFPWIGFVGYEVSYDGLIRVRQDSIRKELDKQRKVIHDVTKAIRKGRRRSDGFILKSTMSRLVGMSVGRVSLWNYKDLESELCWKSGFRELSPNRHSIRQLKLLDKCRNRLYYKLVKYLRSLPKRRQRTEAKVNVGSRQIVAFNKPFSYYYQILERKGQSHNSLTQDSLGGR